MEKAGLAPAPSRLVKPPRVAASPCALECKWVQTVSLTDYEGRPIDRHVVFGQVIGVYIDDAFHPRRPARYRRDAADHARRL